MVLSVGFVHSSEPGFDPERAAAVNLIMLALGCTNSVSMPSVAPISGGTTGALEASAIFVGRVNDRFRVAMRLGVPSGVDGPGDDAMLMVLMSSPVASNISHRRASIEWRIGQASWPCCAPSTTHGMWLVKAETITPEPAGRAPRNDCGEIVKGNMRPALKLAREAFSSLLQSTWQESNNRMVGTVV